MVIGWRSRDGNEHFSWNTETKIVIAAVGSISLMKKALICGLCRIWSGLRRGLVVLKYNKCPKRLSCIFLKLTVLEIYSLMLFSI